MFLIVCEMIFCFMIFNTLSYKKTDRWYYEYYEWTDEWPDDYYGWTDGYYEWTNEYYEQTDEWTDDTTSEQTSAISR